jgi:hypothetical protein
MIRFFTKRPRCSRCRRRRARPNGRYCLKCHSDTMRKYRRNPKRSGAESSALQEDVADHATVGLAYPWVRNVPLGNRLEEVRKTPRWRCFSAVV